MDLGLNGRVAVITGPAKGMGAAISQAFAAEGCRVALVGRDIVAIEPVAEKIRAEADRTRQIIIAEAYRDAQRVKGEGDARAAAIYARAFNENPEFYSFYRSLETYKATFRNKSDIMVLDPSSEFFQYLKQSGGGKGTPRPGTK